MKRKEPLQHAARDGQVPLAVDSFPSTVKSNVNGLFLSTPKNFKSFFMGPQSHGSVVLQKFLELPGQKTSGNPILDLMIVWSW